MADTTLQEGERAYTSLYDKDPVAVIVVDRYEDPATYASGVGYRCMVMADPPVLKKYDARWLSRTPPENSKQAA